MITSELWEYINVVRSPRITFTYIHIHTYIYMYIYIYIYKITSEQFSPLVKFCSLWLPDAQSCSQSWQIPLGSSFHVTLEQPLRIGKAKDDITILQRRTLQMREITVLPQATGCDSGQAESQAASYFYSMYGVFFISFGMYFSV